MNHSDHWAKYVNSFRRTEDWTFANDFYDFLACISKKHKKSHFWNLKKKLNTCSQTLLRQCHTVLLSLWRGARTIRRKGHADVSSRHAAPFCLRRGEITCILINFPATLSRVIARHCVGEISRARRDATRIPKRGCRYRKWWSWRGTNRQTTIRGGVS